MTNPRCISTGLWLILLLGCGGRQDQRPDIVLISIDTLRADHLGCYGYPAPSSPNIDRFSQNAVLFEQTIAAASSTLPSHASLFTSQVPQHHRASHTANRPLAQEAVTLAEVLSAAGYRTLAVVAGGQMAPQFGLGQGFETYVEVDTERPFFDSVSRGLALLDEGPRRPTFLFLHSYEVHHPYEPAAWRLAGLEAGYGGELPDTITVDLLRQASLGQRPLTAADLTHISRAYAGEIQSMDAAFGSLLDGLRARGRGERSVIAFTSDHGEEMAEHGWVGWHGRTLFEPALRVPFLLALPGGIHGGRRIATPVRSIDIAPTLLAAVGLTPPDSFDGEALLPSLGPRPDSEIVFWRETTLDEVGEFEGIRIGGWKLSEGRLFDLLDDPREMRDLAAQRPEELRRLQRALAAWHARRPPLTPAAAAPLPPETMEQIRALGYLGQ